MSKQNNGAEKKNVEHLQQVARAFASQESFDFEILGQGNINDTYLVQGQNSTFILQRINKTVFPDPVKVAENAARVSSYINKKYGGRGIAVGSRVLRTRDGNSFFVDHGDEVWKAQSYIENSRVIERVENSTQAQEIGKCLGRFHNALRKLAPEDLAVVLPGFHDLPVYLETYNRAYAENDRGDRVEHRFCTDCITHLRKYGGFFKEALANGEIGLRVVHGDPKVSNVLFAGTTDRAICMIDLDTVGAGLVLQDIGDLLRSCSCAAEEDDPAGGACDTSLVAAAIQGYLEVQPLSPFELGHIYEALLLISFELGVRFFTDYLRGNSYFKVSREDDNLHRAMGQFALVHSIHGQKTHIRECVADIAATANRKR